MNCKPGDLAYVIAYPSVMHVAGRIVKVLGPGLDFGAGPSWEIDPHLPREDGRMARFAEDCVLRPIRPQPDDAVDESRAWLPPVPLPTIKEIA